MAKTKVREILQSNDTPKEKFEYLWGYYRWHVVILVSGIFFAGYLFVDWMNRPITAFHVTVLAPEVDTEEENQLTEDLNQLIQPEGRNEKAYASFTPHGQLAERFTAQLTAAEYDVILMDEPAFREYADFGTMQEFRLSGLDEEDYYQPDVYDDPMAVDSSHFDIFNQYETTSDMVVMIPENSRRRDAITTFFETQGYDIEFIDND
ncbi:hypothetical protein AB4027_04345 [Alkalibacterium putridalgicola]|uniref:hypothetical protein n=1 Tax=Alkalibacterium putridalgicola TaxID=426703 RepID=UPI0034CEC8DE